MTQDPCLDGDEDNRNYLTAKEIIEWFNDCPIDETPLPNEDEPEDLGNAQVGNGSV